MRPYHSPRWPAPKGHTAAKVKESWRAFIKILQWE